MAKDKITDYDATAANNTDVGGVNIAEGCNFGNMNNMGREIMSHLAETNAGTSPWADTMCVADPADLTKKARIDCGSISTSTTRVINMPDGDVTLVAGTMVTTSGTATLTNKTFDANGTGNSLSNVETADIASGSKSGADATLITGTAGTATYTAQWNADGDLVDGYPVLDEDDMASDSATSLATQQSIKAYVDSNGGLPASVAAGATKCWSRGYPGSSVHELASASDYKAQVHVLVGGTIRVAAWHTKNSASTPVTTVYVNGTSTATLSGDNEQTSDISVSAGDILLFSFNSQGNVHDLEQLWIGAASRSVVVV